PPGIRDARTLSTAPTSLHLKVEALRAAGGSNADIAAMRRSEYGAAAAERLAELDSARAIWNQRLASYRGEEQLLRAAYGSPESAAYRQ
ncbi:lipase secretion chaperone, partial [Bacillus sp. SIMBA_069]